MIRGADIVALRKVMGMGDGQSGLKALSSDVKVFGEKQGRKLWL